jgi:hypothetical protein
MPVECSDCIPRISAMLPSTVVLNKTTGFSYEIAAVVDGMVPGRRYNYRFKSVGSNWPMIVTSETGVISSAKSADCIKNTVTFCRNTGVCTNGTDNVLDHTISDICLVDKSKILGQIVMEVDPIDCQGETIISNILSINCNNCFPSDITTSFNNSNISIGKDQTYTLTSTLSNLQPNKTYSYSFDSIYGDWPVYVNSLTGLIQSTSTTAQIQSDITLCSSSGACPPGSYGVLDYAYDEDIVKKYNKYKNVFRLTISEVECPSNTYTSSSVTVKCSDCNISSAGPKLTSVDIQ